MTRLLVVIFLLVESTAAVAQATREIYSYGRLDQVPSRVTAEEDRAVIEAFVEERRRELIGILERSRANCAALLSGAISPREFAENVDREDATGDQAIAAAYARMQDNLSLRGRAELAREFATRAAYAADVSIAAKYDEMPYEMARRLRWRCEAGFREIE